MKQIPDCGSHILKWRGDCLEVSLSLPSSVKGRAVLRSDISGEWTDWKMRETSPGEFSISVPLSRVGVFSGKCCFFPHGSKTPEWPQGTNFRVKVEPESTRSGNSIYTVFPRQFGSFREVKRRLGHIMGDMGFGIIQTLPPFPVPATYAVMGEYGCPFAATDFFSVDPAMAEFDEYATPLDQFRELIDAVHARGGRFFIDLPANHTGWASTLQTHHPEWFRRDGNGKFISPGAWGVIWADLVELDYAHEELRDYMANVFLFWCRQGVDGFRCDAGYMIPEAAWRHIVDKVREQYPDTVFMLEGLGGELSVTDALLDRAGLDWAYSEIFQTYDRGQFEWYLPAANARAEKFGALVHFAETHDNDRLAKGGAAYARMRVALAALLSHQGAWGIANGVEWLATEKIDVHDKNDLNWGASENMVALIAKLNALVSTHESFSGVSRQRLIQHGDGNFLAVLRQSDCGAPPVLVLVNLDCSRSVHVHWDGNFFPEGECFDLLEERKFDLRQGHELPPGGFLCVSPFAAGGKRCASEASCDAQSAENTIRWTWPEDVRREVCVPDGMQLLIKSPYPYRAMILEGERAFPQMPSYAGDGTRARRLTLEIAVFAPDGVKRSRSALLVLPPMDAARVKLCVSGDEIRRDGTMRTCLSNGAGGDAFVPLRWGEIRSQYDSLLSVNPNPDCPSDRVVLWTRCRAWLQYEGYSHEIAADTIEGFRADPAGRFAQWRFSVPSGMGSKVPLVFHLELARGANAAMLTVSRSDVRGGLREKVRIVLRPDLECRSFHGVTKAYSGEKRIEAEIADTARLSITGGEMHAEGQWCYAVPHPDEAERGQEPCGDLYSPGWISCDLLPGESAQVVCAYRDEGAKAIFQETQLPAGESLPLTPALTEALDLFMVKRGDNKTVIAGYPWFLDWGRDTFIFLRGAIAAGKLDDAEKILAAFAAFEENGTLPNIIYGESAGNRDTVDAQLWFALCVKEWAAKRAEAGLPPTASEVKFRAVVRSIVENYVKGTPNGIRVDRESALVWSPSHFTWMDTNYPACTPRCGYPVDIQAMWIATLRFLGGEWDDLANRAEASVVRYFSSPNGFADCLDAPNCETASSAVPDFSVRPNQLFLITLNALSDCVHARSIVQSCERLLVPGGIRSLAAGDPKYRGYYTGDEDTSRKPAYHNGTVWAWPMPLYAEAAVKCGILTSRQAGSLLAGVVENLNTGCLCHISEIADGDAPHTQKGCRAQAWSASEFLRVLLALKVG